MRFARIGSAASLLAILLFAVGCGGGATPSQPPLAITVAVAPATATAQAGASQQFTATVQNTSNTSVTWTLTQGGTACSPGCGTLNSATANPATYTAPANPPAGSLTVTITATSVADTSKSGSAPITVPAVTVSVAPTTASVAVNTTQQFTATLSNTSNKAVTWTLTQGATACSPGCGTLNSTTANPVAYTAPSTVPASPTVTITATSVADTTKSGSATITVTASNPNNATLNGQYAFLLNGFDAGGAMAIAGSFTADGAGNITGGVEDINRTTGVNTSVAITSGSFSVFADNRGTLTLTTSLGTSTFRFALGGFSAPFVATKLRIIEFDTSGTRVAGFGELQDPTSFSVAQVSGDFAFGGPGADFTGRRFGIAGRFTAAGGSITDGQFDANGHIGGNLGGTSVSQGITGSYTVLAPNGRGTLQLIVPIPFVGGSFTLNFSFYVVSTNELLFISTDPRGTTSEPLSSGQVLAQFGSPAPFRQASLNGISVFNVTGANTGGGADVQAGLLTFDGAGGFSLSADENNAGTVSANSASGTYSVQPDGLGRVTTTTAGTGVTPVLYLVTENKAFMVFNDTFVTTGFFEPQAAGPFSNSSLPEGFYTLGTTAPATAKVTDFSGMLFLNGSGSCSATRDEAAPTGLSPDNAFFCNYSVQASPNNGRGTLTLTNVISGSSSGFVFYIASPFSPFRLSKAVLIDVTAGATNPAVSVVTP